jgi:D-3-phosphoglycerate dehydrogenase
MSLLGADVILEPDVSAAELPRRIGESEILVVRSTAVTEETIASAPRLELIVRAGAGVNTIDVNSASERGIYVANCPGKNAQAVAELVIGLLVALDRHIVDAATALRAGQWHKNLYGNGRGLHGRQLGILGLGATGQAVAHAASGLGMGVHAWSRSLTPQRAAAAGIHFCATPLELARQVDAVTIHLAANAATYHCINQKFLSQMRRGAYLINTSRGALVDTAALKAAIIEKGLRVALDVFEDEPAASGEPFADVELARMVVGTPHIGASTQEAAEAVAREVVRVIGSYVAGGKPINALNAPRALITANHAPEPEYAY